MKKKLPGFFLDPSGRSLVHPSPVAQDEDAVVPGTFNKAKVMEILGMASPQECPEIGYVRRRTQTMEGSSSCAPNNDDAGKAVAFPLPFHPTNQKPACTDMIGAPGPSQMSSMPPQHRPLEKAVFPQEFAMSNWAPKLFQFSCLTGMSVMLDNVDEHALSPPPRLHNVKGSKPVAALKQEGTFPSEKHYLPSPLRTQASPVAHPLPPLSRSPSNEQASMLSGDDKLDMVSKQNLSYNLPIPNGCTVQEAKTLICPMEKLGTQARALPYNITGLNDCVVQEGIRTLPSPLPKLGIKGRAVPYNLPIGNEYGLRDATALPSPRAKLGNQERSPQVSPPLDAAALHSPMAKLGMQEKSPLMSTPLWEPPIYQFNESTTRRLMSSPSLTRHSPRWSPRGSFASVPNSPLRSPRNLCPHKWRKGAVLGQGTFGIVYEGLNQDDGSFFAVKVSSSSDVSPEIQQEVDVLSKLAHPNIVRYYGSSVENGRLCIFLELVRMGSLEAILRKYKRFEDNTIRSYTRQILLGLEYLHAKKTMHRDLKCGNILVDVTGQVKLSDFGVAKEVDETLASSLKGTPLYMAPEVLTAKKDSYSFPADIWSLGCTVLEMADGKPPWSNLQGFGFLFKVKKGELPPLPDHLSPEGKDFIRRCLKFNAKDRPTALELLQHPFVGNASIPEAFIPRAPASPVPTSPWFPFSSVNDGQDHGDTTHLPTLELQCTL